MTEITVENITPEVYTDDFIVDCARVSYAKRANQFTPEQNKKLLKYLFNPPDSVPHWAPFAGPRICFRIYQTAEEWLEFFNQANLNGFSGLFIGTKRTGQGEAYLEYELSGSLWAWHENLAYFHHLVQWDLSCWLSEQFPIAWEEVMGHRPTRLGEQTWARPVIPSDESTRYYNLRIKAPIFVARQLIKHQKEMVWSETCFDETTEVLTKRGWIFWPEVTENDELACPTEEGTWSFQKHQGLIKTWYEGPLYYFFNRDLDVACTANHNLYVSMRTGVDSWAPYTLVQAKNVVGTSRPKFSPLPVIDRPQGSEDDYWEGFLYGVYLGDGSLSKDGKRVYYHVKKQKKKEMLRNLMIKKPQYTWNETSQDDGFSYFRMYPNGDARFSGGVSTKEIQLTGDESLQYLNGILEGLIATDGHISAKNNTSFSTTSKYLRDSLCHLCDLLGRDVSIHTSVRDGWSDSYKFTIKTNRPRVVREYAESQFSGMVYCAQSPTGLLLVRRNGKKAVVGNSRRYIKTEPELWWPKEFHKAPTHSKQGASDELFDFKLMISPFGPDTPVSFPSWKNVWKAFIHDVVNVYNKTIEAGMAPEEARMILPQNMMTEWIWTGSQRAFRRVLRERLAPGAQKSGTRETAEKIKLALGW